MASQLDFAGGTFVDGLVADADDSLRVVDAAVESHRRIVIAFVGLAFEARIAAAPGVKVVCRTAGSELEEVADSAVRQGYRAMISFGVAGGLASHLRAGDWVVASSIRRIEKSQRHRCRVVPEAPWHDSGRHPRADCRRR